MDLAQEAFLEAFAHLDQFSPDKAFAPWLYRIVHNRSLNWLAKRKHPSAPQSTSDGFLESRSKEDFTESLGNRIDKKIFVEKIRVAVAQLPPKLKGTFVLRYLEDKSVKEVAEILSQPINTVKTHLFRARNLLRKSLKDRGKDEKL